MQQPHILCSPGDVAENVLVAGDPARVLRAAEYIDAWKEVAYNREFRTVTGKYKDIPVTISSTGIGGASTAIAIEELVICGARRIVRIGSSGALQSHIRCGDLLTASAAVRLDGTSQKYVPAAFPAVADMKLLAVIDATSTDLGFTHHVGIIHSHDSLYTDNQNEIEEHWHKRGVLGSDMETATLFTLASLRGIEAGSILNVVVEYSQDVKEGISSYNETVRGEARQIELALESLFRHSQSK